MCQHIIESSHYFKSDYIKLLYEHGSDNHEGDNEVQENEEEQALKEMLFNSLGDASTYLNENFGTPKSKLRTRETIIEVGKANGIDVKITD